MCGGFDSDDCIAERMLNIQNFSQAFVGNSRYGWFNEGQTEGPSAHLHREFINALYAERTSRIGMTHLISKIATAPWVTAPGQWEEGALRWCFYDCNVLGDAAMAIWTAEPISVQVSYPDSISMSQTSLQVTVSSPGNEVEGLACTLLKDDVFHGLGIVDSSGIATIEIEPGINEVGFAEIVISGYNCLPISFLISIVSNSGSQSARIWMDGKFTDWTSISPIYSDVIGDQQAGDIDFGALKIANDERFLYLNIEIGDELNLQDENEITLYLDTDNDANTGIAINGIGAEIKWIFGERQGQFVVNSNFYTIYHEYLGEVSAPTVSSNKFEIALDRTLSAYGHPLFPQNSFKIVFHDNGLGQDYLPRCWRNYLLCL